MSINWIDILIVSILTVSTLLSLWRGFMRESISLLTWLFAFWGAFCGTAWLSTLLKPWINSSSGRQGISFALIFFGVLIIGGVLNYGINRFVKHTGLSAVNGLLGMGFGFLRGLLIVVVMVMIAQFTVLPKTPAWKHALCLPPLEKAAKSLRTFIPLTGGKP